jgi:hypothetical protein
MPAIGTGAGKSVNAPTPKRVVAKVKPAKAPTTPQVRQAQAQEQQYASQGRAVRAVARQQRKAARTDQVVGDKPQTRAADMRAADAYNRAHPVKVKAKSTGGPLLAVIHAPIGAAEGAAQLAVKGASAYAKPIIKAVKNDDMGGMSVIPSAVKTVGHAAADAAELAVTTPSSVAHLASTAVHHPAKVPGLLAAPYKELAKHPGAFISEHPVSTALMLAPGVRLPGRAVGRVARIAGKQSLERAAATLPGTALKEARTGSRDVVVRAVQSRADKKNPSPSMTAAAVQRRVDEHFDLAKQHTAHAEAQAVHATRKATKGQPKAVRRDAITQAREQAREAAQQENDARFAHEFGATGRLSTGAAEREFAGRERKVAEGHLQQAKAQATTADAAHEEALANARVARAKVHRSSKLAALEFRRRDALREVAQAQRAQVGGVAEFGVARGRAQILSRNVSGTAAERRAASATVPVGTPQYAAGGHGIRLVGDELAARTQRVRVARDRVKGLDQEIATERARIKGIPPAEHQALLDSIHGRATARLSLHEARTAAEAAKAQHIAAKTAMRDATIVHPAGEGRLFAHKADAATLVRKLNEGTPEGGPLTFVVRQAGDRYAAVPKVAAQRLAKHQGVGSSKATMAKVMRTSRGAFTQAVLPLSPKWLAGQGVEAGIRSAVARAGPMDLLRMNRVVKKLSAERAGAGNELLMRISGGHFGLTGPARDFAQGKSLAEEFTDTSLERPARAATLAGRPLRAVRSGWSHYTNAMLGSINGVLENTARKAMAGQAIRQGPLMERRIVGLSDKAIKDAADGLRGSENQVALAREVDRMYGKYQKFSPDMRSLLLHWTPFLPWYLNVATFLGKVLPVDHPLQAALLADTSAATEEWRKSHRLSLLASDHLPDFLLGSAPVGKGNSYQRIAHYTPFGVGSDVTGAVGSLALPQATGAFLNALGVDWKGQRLTHGGSHGKEFNQGERLIRALVTVAESQVPGVTQAGAISGVTPRYVDKNSPESIKSPGRVLKGYLPTTATSNNEPPATGSGRAVGRVKLGGVSGGRVKLSGGVTGRVKLGG